MLNPEYVDYDRKFSSDLKIGFTDENVDSSLDIYLSNKNAFELAIMILKKSVYRDEGHNNMKFDREIKHKFMDYVFKNFEAEINERIVARDL